MPRHLPGPATIGRRSWRRLQTCVQAGSGGRPSLSAARLWYEPHLERIHEDAIIRRADLVQLEQIEQGIPRRERFLTELTLDPPDATSDQAACRCLTRTT